MLASKLDTVVDSLDESLAESSGSWNNGRSDIELYLGFASKPDICVCFLLSVASSSSTELIVYCSSCVMLMALVPLVRGVVGDPRVWCWGVTPSVMGSAECVRSVQYSNTHSQIWPLFRMV